MLPFDQFAAGPPLSGVPQFPPLGIDPFGMPPTVGTDTLGPGFSGVDPMGMGDMGGTPVFDTGMDPERIIQMLQEAPPDPTNPAREKPSLDVLLARKKRELDFWRPLKERQVEDEELYKLQTDIDEMVGRDEVGASETVVMNDPQVLIEKVANMLSAADPTIDVIARDPGLKEIAQKVKDFLYWWRDETDSRWYAKLNNTVARDELHYLCLRGWLAGRLMLDPGDPDFPWRYDVIDPLHVYPRIGAKGLRYVWHIYKDSKINVMNDMGWDNNVLQQIEETLKGASDLTDVEIASYYDDVWHVMLINDTEVWAAPHNYGFVPWDIGVGSGSPIRRTDPRYGNDGGRNDFTKYWGVSIFESIKDVYAQLNKLASAVMTETMKAPNPPIVIKTNTATGQAEARTIDTSVGATSYILEGEDFKTVDYGFRPSELQPMMQMLQDARNRGTLPSVMYGEGASYLSGFAVSLLQSGSRDIILPIIRSHEHYLTALFKAVLRMTAEIYPFPINMVETDPQTGARSQMTTITGDDIKAVGYYLKVSYQNVFPQDRNASAQAAAMLVDKKIISLDTARGIEYIGLKNPTLENKKVLGDLAYFDPLVVQTSIPYALMTTDPQLYLIYQQAQMEKMRQEAMQFQMAMATGQPPPGPGGPQGKPPGRPGVPPNQSATGRPPEPANAAQVGNRPF